jgi:predicted kinase
LNDATTTMDRAQLLAYLTEGSAPTYIVMVGAPGSGKTTIAETWERQCITVISMDRLLLQKPWLMSLLEMLAEEFERQIDAALTSGHTIVDDNLNLGRSERAKLAKRAMAKGYRVVFVHLDASEELCLRQNQQRQPRVPDHRLKELWSVLQEQRPDVTEGEVYRLVPITDENRYTVERVRRKHPLKAQKRWWEFWKAFCVLLSTLGLNT